MNPKNPKVDAYLARAKTWQKEQQKLRKIALDCQLTEELKWGVPCYTYDSSNVVVIHAFKEYCAYLFFKGALLKDPEGILIQQTKNTQATRHIRFTNLKEIVALESVLKAYIDNAIEVQKAGLKVKMKETSEFPVAEEFRKKMAEVPGLKAAFNALTPGRQRGYLLHFSSAKQAKTRIARIDKCLPQILSGKGIDDK